MSKQILFRYCKLSRAAELLSVHVSDLINLAVMGDIDCLIRLTNAPAKFYLWNEKLQLIKTMGNYFYFGGNSETYTSKLLGINSLSNFSYVKDVCKISKRDKHSACDFHNNDKQEEYRVELDINANGLWVLPSYIIENIESKKEAHCGNTFYLHGDYIFRPDSYINIYPEDECKIYESDLYITCEDLFKIMDGDFDKTAIKNETLLKPSNSTIDSIEKEANNQSKQNTIHQTQIKAMESRVKIHNAINRLLINHPSNPNSDDDRYRNKNNIIIKGRVAKLIINHEATLFEEGVSPIKDDKLLRSIVSDYLDEMGWKRR
ncbi:hypothetical protein IR150_03170 [Providencia alcalifaciens]|uniref:hypothetical protein n=1 Tax=Providencia alcalifaciens TaxID=126385 RepID=UPI0015CFD920|nr:hypothetical protein [Providencia alcalifaciens]MBF0690510.1 hypothetical protein [Providencia alcalifaciens]NYS89014.1 hypothetical protein [Providencia alcalifaciens]